MRADPGIKRERDLTDMSFTRRFQQFLVERRLLRRPPSVSLQTFINEWRTLHPAIDLVLAPHPPESLRASDIGRLEGFLAGFSVARNALVASRREGSYTDIWQIVAIGRDEVRNSRVLHWMLNPSGSHGQQGDLLQSLLARIAIRAGNDSVLAPGHLLDAYVAYLESDFDNDGKSRVDIVIDGTDALLFIEVKIDASEGKDQLARYVRIAESRARGRPWAVVYLTVSGHQLNAEVSLAQISQELREHVIEITWRDVGRAIGSHLAGSGIPERNRFRTSPAGHLLRQFKHHIERF
jgi:PD-(D/E)XK nuclease superfamily